MLLIVGRPAWPGSVVECRVACQRDCTALRPLSGTANGRFTVIKIDPISKEQEKIIRDIIKWEDESAKSDFVISPRWSLGMKDA